MKRQHLASALLALAFVLLIPGITLPVIDLSGDVEKREIAELGKAMISAQDSGLAMFGGIASRLIDNLNTEGSVSVYRERRSILGTVRELASHGHWLVAFLIVSFSVIVPLTKGGLLLFAASGTQNAGRRRARRVADAVSKWSMADVFVIAILVAYLAANATQDGAEIVRFDAHFAAGFYYFLGYCLLSIASAQLMPAPAAGQAEVL